MGQFKGKKGLILGVANDRSIAWAIAEFIMREGGECGFTHLPDAPEDLKRKNRRRVAQCTEGHERAKFLVPLDVRDDSNIAAVMDQTASVFGKIDFLLHSIAYADREDLKRDTVETSGRIQLAMEISAYSLIAVTKRPRDHERASAIATMTYFGGRSVCRAQRDGGLQGGARRHRPIPGP